jgi:polyhydroxyalkanoate synthesis regulator phasin
VIWDLAAVAVKSRVSDMTSQSHQQQGSNNNLTTDDCIRAARRLVDCIREQNEHIAQQNERIAALEDRVNQLEKQKHQH